MKKALLFSALVVGVFSLPAYADGHGDGERKKGGMFKKIDTNEDGSFSRAEFDAMYHERFEKMDVNGDGAISKEEAEDHRENRLKKRKERLENKKSADD